MYNVVIEHIFYREIKNSEYRAQYLMLETSKDVNSYCDLCERGFETMVPTLERTPTSRWDHLYRSQRGFETFNISLMDHKITGENPIHHHSLVLTRYRNMLKNAIKNGPIIINSKGGWQPLNAEEHNTISKEAITNLSLLDHSVDIRLNKNSKFLNLENDPQLEQYTLNELPKLDKHFSYVTNMRLFSNEKLASVINDFKRRGGVGLWVYTTGSDIEQMKEYCSLAN